MKFLKLFALSIVVSGSLFLVTPTIVKAAPSTSVVPTVVKDLKAPQVATVNVTKYHILSQKNNLFKITFFLENKTNIDAKSTYGIELVGVNAGKQFLADQKVYYETSEIKAHGFISRDINYESPLALSGEYELFLSNIKENGIHYGRVSLGKVTLKSSVKGLDINVPTCYVQVVGEKDEPRYDIFKAKELDKGQQLRLTCSAENGSDKVLSLKPVYKTTKTVTSEKVTTTIKGDMNPIDFKAKEKKDFSVVIPMSNTPEVYSLKMNLSDETTISNPVNVIYVIRPGVTDKIVTGVKNYKAIIAIFLAIIIVMSGIIVYFKKFKKKNIVNTETPIN